MTWFEVCGSYRGHPSLFLWVSSYKLTSFLKWRVSQATCHQTRLPRGYCASETTICGPGTWEPLLCLITSPTKFTCDFSSNGSVRLEDDGCPGMQWESHMARIFIYDVLSFICIGFVLCCVFCCCLFVFWYRVWTLSLPWLHTCSRNAVKCKQHCTFLYKPPVTVKACCSHPSNHLPRLDLLQAKIPLSYHIINKRH